METSKFNKAQIKQGSFSKKASLLGLQIPSGEVYMNVKTSCSKASLEQLAHVLGARVVSIHGSWTFNAAEDSDNAVAEPHTTHTSGLSPFQTYQLIPIGNYSKPGSRRALKLPNGDLMFNFDDEISGQMLGLIRSQLNAEIIVVHGLWTFTPDTKAK